MALYGSLVMLIKKIDQLLGLGMKGLLYVELIAKESVRDVHSSFAVIIKNPAWKLVQALNTMRDENGKVLIKGWYDDIMPLSKMILI